MRRLALLAPSLVVLALPGCVEPPPPPAAPVDACNAAAYQGLVGQSSAVLHSMMLPAGSRVIGPNDVVTMDFRPQRLNVEVGAAGRIEKVACY